MVTLLVVAHSGLAREFCHAASFILGEEPVPLVYIGAQAGESREAIAKRLRTFFEGTTGDVLVLADLYGSTHVNLCLPYLECGHIEMISGFNLPLLLKAITLKDKLSVSELSKNLVTYGSEHVCLSGPSPEETA